MTDPISRLQLAQAEVDKVFGQDFAAKHPEVVSAVMISASLDWAWFGRQSDITTERNHKQSHVEWQKISSRSVSAASASKSKVKLYRCHKNIAQKSISSYWRMICAEGRLPLVSIPQSGRSER